jgi:hypothetical protein
MKVKLKLLLKAGLAILIALVFNWTFFNSIQSYTRIMLHEMYTYDGNIDSLVVGGSEVFKAYDAKKASTLMKQNVFNAGSASQQLGGSLAVIKEVSKYHKLKTIYLDMGFQRNQSNKEGELQTYILTDYFRFGLNKYKFLFETAGFKGIQNDIMPCIHRNGNPRDIVRGKLSKDYRNFGYKNVTHPTEEYAGDGFVYTFKHAKQGDYFEIAENINSNQVLSKYAERKLEQITKFCRENNIKLVLVETPLPDATLSKENYQPYVNYMRAYANKNKLVYLNFNLLKKGNMDLTYEDYFDAAHLSGKGAEKFTKVFARIAQITSDSKNKADQFFYSSYKEKLLNNADETVR